jgi:hypothetical protein
MDKMLDEMNDDRPVAFGNYYETLDTQEIKCVRNAAKTVACSKPGDLLDQALGPVGLSQASSR